MFRSDSSVSWLMNNPYLIKYRPKKETPLFKVDSVQLAEILLSEGSYVDARDRGGETALFKAVRDNREKMVVTLLKHSADPNATDVSGTPPISNCTSAEIAKILLNHGADVNLHNNYGVTALHHADREDVVSVLIENGADIDARDLMGRTPLYHSLSVNVSRILLDNGANVNAKALNHETPLHSAALYNCFDLVSLLLQFGADPQAKTTKGDTPLHNAQSRYVAEALLNHGADIDTRNNDEKTTLHLKVRHSLYIDLVSFLLENGADTNLRDTLGMTPLHIASISKSRELIQILLEYGSDITITNKAGESPLDFALNDGDEPLLSLFKLQIIRLREAGQLYTSRLTHDFHPSKAEEERYQDFELRCRSEISQFRDNHSIYLYRILSASDPRYAMNQSFSRINFEDYPIYGSLLKRKLESDKRKIRLLLRATESLNHILKVELPVDIEWKILSYLSNIELVEFIDKVVSIVHNPDTSDL